MAILKNLQKAAQAKIGQRVTVGNNRTIERTESGYVCRLHGFSVVVIDTRTAPDAEITVDHHGYMTNTTTAAISDFLKAFGVNGHVSMCRPKGTMTLSVAGQDPVTTGGQQISFFAPVKLV